jgi:hypothetical protein
MLYHKEIGLPQNVQNYFGRSFRLSYSKHAQQACVHDRYGVIMKPPFKINVSPDNLFEVETDDITKNIIKLTIRVRYDDKFDIAIAFIPDYDVGFVKTCWLNCSDDVHKTLKRELYASP